MKTMKKILFFLSAMFVGISISAQTADELKKELSTKKDEISKLEKEASSLQSKIDALPGWRKGAFGTIGGSLSGFDNWYSRTSPTASAGNIGITVNGFANLIEEKFFWRNSIGINLGWVKLDEKGVGGDEGFDTATDVFTISSLYGKNLSDKWAVSALGEYRTTLIDNFNNPGFLDIGVGFTWTPLNNLVVVIHPANYNIVFSSGEGSDVYSSSPGAKIVADYNATYNKLSVKSNLSMFQSYQDGDLSNWTWTNSLGYTLWKGIGVGFELGLRKNKQEAASFQNVLLPAADNKLQSYYLFGLNYSL
jgi:hypothetical protein